MFTLTLHSHGIKDLKNVSFLAPSPVSTQGFVDPTRSTFAMGEWLRFVEDNYYEQFDKEFLIVLLPRQTPRQLKDTYLVPNFLDPYVSARFAVYTVVATLTHDSNLLHMPGYTAQVRDGDEKWSVGAVSLQDGWYQATLRSHL